MKRLIAEFEKQSFTQIIFPHKNSDWCEYLKEAESNFIEIIKAVIKYQKCLVICADKPYVESLFEDDKNLFFVEYEGDDTWARDCSALSIEDDKKVRLLDFTFNGWGGKFESTKDNLMSKAISKYYDSEMESVNFILEGGGVESNGVDTILTTSNCLLNKNRNKTLTKEQITKKLKDIFGVDDVLYLNHGYLAGDDTDSHIDTLARFVDKSTIAYIACDDKDDEHYKELKLMESELQTIAKEKKYKLVPLPMSSPIYFEDERLPATYANFLFVNGAILVPTYGIKEDDIALKIFRDNFKSRDIIPINCSTLIKQHGSLHCVTMNFANGIKIKL